MLLKELRLDESLREVLRPHSASEAEEMRASLERDGYCSDIVVWDGTPIIVDGAFRYQHWMAAESAWKAAHREWEVAHAAWRLKRPSAITRSLGARDTEEPVDPKPPQPLGFIRKPFKDREAVIQFLREQHPTRYRLRLEDLVIDEEFDVALRRQTPLEAEEMAASIAQLGYLAPLIVWRGICADGMHRLRFWRAAHAEWLSVGLLLGLPEPPRPKFEEREFADRDAVKKFIATNQGSRRNMSQNELALLLGKQLVQAVESGEDAKQAASRIAAERGVSAKTVERAGEFHYSVEAIAPLVEKVLGKDLRDVVKDPDGPSQSQIVTLAERVREKRTMSAKTGCPLDAFVNPATGKTLEQQFAEEAVKPRKEHRLDAAQQTRPPSWQAKFLAFEKVMERVMEEGDDEEIIAAKACMKKLMSKLRPSADSVSRPTPEIPVKVNGTPIAEYKAQEAAT